MCMPNYIILNVFYLFRKASSKLAAGDCDFSSNIDEGKLYLKNKFINEKILSSMRHPR